MNCRSRLFLPRCRWAATRLNIARLAVLAALPWCRRQSSWGLARRNVRWPGAWARARPWCRRLLRFREEVRSPAKAEAIAVPDLAVRWTRDQPQPRPAAMAGAAIRASWFPASLARSSACPAAEAAALWLCRPPEAISRAWEDRAAARESDAVTDRAAASPVPARERAREGTRPWIRPQRARRNFALSRPRRRRHRNQRLARNARSFGEGRQQQRREPCPASAQAQISPLRPDARTPIPKIAARTSR